MSVINEKLLENLKVVKRNGKKVDFDTTKVAIAIKKGFDGANKAEDEKKRKDIETRNKAEQMINEIDKALAEQGDKIDANQKQQAEQLKTELKTALDNNDMATLEAKMSELEQMAQQMASYAYQQQQANPNSGAGQTTSNNNDDNVVDADFEEKN